MASLFNKPGAIPGTRDFGLSESLFGIGKYASKPQVKGASTGPTTGYQSVQPPQQGPPAPTATSTSGGSGGGSSSSLFGNIASAPMQQQQSGGPDTSGIDSAFAPAMHAYDQFASSLQSQLSGQSPLQGADQLQADASNSRSLFQSGLADKQANFAQQRGAAQSQTDTAVNEARRQGSEMMQGLQARFGGSTGTGGFIGELTGRQVLQNIAQNRTHLQDTIMHINDAQASAEKEVGRQIENLDAQLQSAVQGLRNNLMSEIQNINMKRGELESQKGLSKVDALNKFRADQAQVEAANTQFKQQLFLKLQNVKSTAEQMKGQTAEQFAAHLESLKAQGIDTSGAQFGMTDQGNVDNVMFRPKQEDDSGWDI